MIISVHKHFMSLFWHRVNTVQHTPSQYIHRKVTTANQYISHLIDLTSCPLGLTKTDQWKNVVKY